MLDITHLFIAAVFLLAGFVKGTIGVGLPAIAIGLLAVVIPPAEAAAILVAPAFLTNVWQMFAGPALGPIVKRLWPMLVGVCLGTWSCIGVMTGPGARWGAALMGVSLAIYAVIGLASVRFSLPRRMEAWAGPLAGAITGAITAMTGVFAIPAAPYLQAIGFEKDHLVQALGLSFTVSSAAFGVNVLVDGSLKPAMLGIVGAAFAICCLGMWLGQLTRERLSPEVFRRWFFAGLLALGVFQVVRVVWHG